MTSAVATAIATERDRGHPRLARAALAAWRRRDASRANGRLVLADREAGVVLVDERLAVEAERLGVRAEEARARTSGAGRMSKRSSSSARRYFGRIFVRSSSSGKSRFWRRRASRRLEPMSNMNAAL